MVSATGFLVAVLAAVASAAPSCKPNTPILPKTGGTELTAPAANLVLKKITVGHGIQNYTCSSTSANATAAGAVAMLYDVTAIHPSQPNGITQKKWDSLPTDLLFYKGIPLRKLAGTHYGADPVAPFFMPGEDVLLDGYPKLKVIGHHYFDSNSVPMFDLYTTGLKASVTKLENVDAPTGASRGPLDTGAVQWLKLGDSSRGLSKGLSIVYRVVTAGGAGLKCADAGTGVHSVPYTTYYWFYG